MGVWVGGGGGGGYSISPGQIHKSFDDDSKLICQVTQEQVSSRKEILLWNKLATIRIIFLQYTVAGAVPAYYHHQIAAIPSFSCMTLYIA